MGFCNNGKFSCFFFFLTNVLSIQMFSMMGTGTESFGNGEAEAELKAFEALV